MIQPTGDIAHKWSDQERTEDVGFDSDISFSKMMLSDNVFNGLQKNGFVNPSPIQRRAIPLGRNGIDLLVQAKSGTGKTLVFATIILEAFDSKCEKPQSLVIAPTREIAVQIEFILKSISCATPGFKVCSFIGGLNITDDRKNIQGCRAIVGTPGRILHLLTNNILCTSDISLVVLDEADQLMDKSFNKDIQRILTYINTKRQILAVSATFNNEIQNELQKFMKNPIGVTPKRDIPILLGVKQFALLMKSENCDEFQTYPQNSMQLMFSKVRTIQNIFSIVQFKQCIIFSNSLSRAESYCNYLVQNGWSVELITGSQDQKVRLGVFSNFKTLKCRILLTTDLMARGIDSENVDLVINLDVPINSVVYLHRIGRSGRFGTHGNAVTLISSIEEEIQFRNLLGAIGSKTMSVLKFPTSEFSGGDLANYAIDYPINNNVCLKDNEIVNDSTINIDSSLQSLNNNSEHLTKTEIIDDKQKSLIERNTKLIKTASLLIDLPEKRSALDDLTKLFDNGITSRETINSIAENKENKIHQSNESVISKQESKIGDMELFNENLFAEYIGKTTAVPSIKSIVNIDNSLTKSDVANNYEKSNGTQIPNKLQQNIPIKSINKIENEIFTPNLFEEYNKIKSTKISSNKNEHNVDHCVSESNLQNPIIEISNELNSDENLKNYKQYSSISEQYDSSNGSSENDDYFVAKNSSTKLKILKKNNVDSIETDISTLSTSDEELGSMFYGSYDEDNENIEDSDSYLSDNSISTGTLSNSTNNSQRIWDLQYHRQFQQIQNYVTCVKSFNNISF